MKLLQYLENLETTPTKLYITRDGEESDLLLEFDNAKEYMDKEVELAVEINKTVRKPHFNLLTPCMSIVSNEMVVTVTLRKDSKES